MKITILTGIVLTMATTLHAGVPIVAHRGASADAPENTLPAFRLAWEQGADAIEGDFYLTKDGQIACIHDADTKRVAGTKLVVKDSTLAELQQLDVGMWKDPKWAATKIPTIAEVLAVVPKGKRIYIEIKGDETMVPRLLEEIAKSGLSHEQVVIISFNAKAIGAVKSTAPYYKSYWLSGFKKDDAGNITPTIETILETLKKCHADGFSSAYDLVERSIVQRVLDEGYEYHVWTVDDPETAKRFVEWGAGSITTNKPGLIRAVLAESRTTASPAKMEWIHVSKDGKGFVRGNSQRPFVAWGFNYDHDTSNRLLEEYWINEWDKVVGDFREMKELGANTVRIHLQVSRFLKSPSEANTEALGQLARLLRLAEETGLYLDITGLGCYLKKEVPAWYDSLSEKDRWAAQAVFWTAVSKVCADSPAIFCYDLMNEPIVPGGDKKENEWLVGEFAGMNFVQRISLDPAARTQEKIARQWIDTLVTAIRTQVKRHLITVGEIPWALSFPGAKPLFHAKEVGHGLDFVSVHFYPKKGEVDKALKALAVYEVGKPLIVEEMFPLECSIEDLDAFIEGSRPIADGWIGFYWGKTIEEYAKDDKLDIAGAITKSWLEYFRKKTTVIYSNIVDR